MAALVEDSIGRDRLREEGLNTLRGLDIDKLGYKLTAIGRGGKSVEQGGTGDGIGSTSKALECLYQLHLLSDKCLPPLMEIMEGLVNNEGEEEQNNSNTLQQPDGGGEGESSSSSSAMRSAYNGLLKTAQDLDGARRLAEKVIDFDRAPRDFLINASLDEDLHEVKSDLNKIDSELEQIHEEMNDFWGEISGSGNNEVKLEDTDANNNTSCAWQFRIINTNSAKKLEEQSGIQVHRILKNGVYFSTKELRELGTKKHDLMMEYESKQRTIVTQCMSVASTYVPVLERASVLLAELDVLASLAHVAAYSNGGYCKPEMTDGEEDGLGIEVSTMALDFPSAVPSSVDLILTWNMNACT